MRFRRVIPASIISLLLVAAVAAPASAGRPDTGVHYILTSATADLLQGGLWECGEGQDAAGATLSMAFNMGLGQSPIGSGQWAPWADTDPYLSVFGCDQEGWSFSAHSGDITGQFDSALFGVDVFDSAWLHVTLPMYDDDWAVTGVTMAFDLEWTGVGRAVPGHWREGLTSEVSRSAPAVVNGTVVIAGLDTLGVPMDELTFEVVDNTDNTFINWANHVEH